ncbi:MAG: hypothetical protein IJ356_08750 [Erysipelotrichaceae bacterium]|nr:hypothetical protein [Erysipelotrichaceae bacterium]
MEFKKFLTIKILPLLIVLCCALTISNSEQDVKEAPILLSMENLEIENCSVERARALVAPYFYGGNEVGDHYQLVASLLHDTDGRYSVWVEIAYVEKIELLRRCFEASVAGISKAEKDTYEQALMYLYSLDFEEWDIEEGYSTVDLHDIPLNCNYSIVLLQDNKIMKIQLPFFIEMNDERKAMFIELFSRSDEIFADTSNLN